MTNRYLTAAVGALTQAVATTFDSTCTITTPGATIDPTTKHGTPGFTARATGVPCLIRPERGLLRPDTADRLMVRQPWILTLPVGTAIAIRDQVVHDGDGRTYEVVDLLAASWEAARQVRAIEVPTHG